MIKVLWFSNVPFQDSSLKSSGTWLAEMARALLETGEVELYNISSGNVKKTVNHDCGTIRQWLVPARKPNIHGLPSKRIIKSIQQITAEVQPDIIHIWGTENYWGLLKSRGYLTGKAILEIQGLKFAIEHHFYSGLTFRDILQCIGIKELLKPSASIVGMKRSFKKWGRFEREMLQKHQYISTQSGWVREQVKSVNPGAHIFKTSIMLRREFLESGKWEQGRCVPYRIFTSVSSFVPYKGLHILLRAISLLKRQFPEIRLYIAGNFRASGIRQDGYSKWLLKIIRRMGIIENIHWLGPLSAAQLVEEMHLANAVVVPSFIESYCLALDEALTVGVPTVASYTGAMPELATDGESALFFPPGDVVMCAGAIEMILVNPNFAGSLSDFAYTAKRRTEISGIGYAQLATYKYVIHSKKQNDH